MENKYLISRNPDLNAGFMRYLRLRLAVTSVTPSAARGMGPKGTIQAARHYLSRMHLDSFAEVANSKEFNILLDTVTRRCKRRLPEGGRHWGAARKFLNLYLRGAFYNTYLCQAYKLYRLGEFLEIPLDRHVATRLKNEANRGVLPRWKSVISLDRQDSVKYQDFAIKVAESMGTYRVHLDLIYWRHPNG